MKEIKNFVKSQVLEIEALPAGKSYPATVTLYQSAGSTRFVFSMLPAQAREMAAALEACARELESAAKEQAGELGGLAS